MYIKYSLNVMNNNITAALQKDLGKIPDRNLRNRNRLVFKQHIEKPRKKIPELG